MPAAHDAASSSGSVHPDEVTLLESRGWSAASVACEPKIVALRALADLAAPEPVPSVSYQSRGNVLVIAGSHAQRARNAAQALASRLHVTLLEAEPGESAPGIQCWSGRIEEATGFLGEFAIAIAQLRTAPGAAAATKPAAAKFDLVLDLGDKPLFAMRQPPQGYFRPASAEDPLGDLLEEIGSAVGEFEKPRFFTYRDSICAHSRSQVVGCDACIRICSTAAISPDGDHVKVDPHLCMGCGACATVCPSGAMGYQYPRVSDRGAQIKHLMAAHRAAGGAEACIVFHNGHDARALLASAAASGHGLPARALPLEAWHVAAIGLDLMLPAIAFGASQVVVLTAGSEDREYLEALRHQMAIGQTILSALGYEGIHFAVIEAATPHAIASKFAALAPARTVATPATFHVGNDKRTAIEFAVEHLAKQAPHLVESIALPPESPFGEIHVDREKCTMCMACVGACPESALMDGVDKPLLKFIERNCVQCGLCEGTCPEEAITLSPRLLLTPAVREARLLNETVPFHCISCGKAFGTKQMVDAMTGRLAAHSMFTQGSALRRLQMCADCRVVDMMSSKDEMSILKLGSGS
ncbi:MAG: 4Fe-4S binding protein [Betaproteobacteria bacterium]